MERLTEKIEDGRSVLKENYAYVVNVKHGSFIEGKAIDKLAEYEQAEEDGLIPKFHLGDEFWCLKLDKVVKAKIVTLQQKKDGSWNYTLSREISKNYHDIAYYKEREYGKYFWSTKAEAEQALAKMKGV